MIKAYEGKLSEYVIPVEELGFDPLVPTNVDWSALDSIKFLFDSLLPTIFMFCLIEMLNFLC